MDKALDQRIPLVSVVVITYNSSNTVTETLESIKKQSYKNIELVITDDSSKDSTYEICKGWCEKNKNFFTEVVICKTDNNLGVSNNCNNGVEHCHGEWVKIIAGDDLLEKDCIMHNIDFINQNPNCRILFSRSVVFEDKSTMVLGLRPGDSFQCANSALLEFEDLIVKDFVNPTTVFAEKNLLYEVGLYNNDYPFMEDYPMWFKILKNGTRIYYNPVVTVRYRVSSTSLSTSAKRGAINLRWLSCYNRFFHDCIKPELYKRKKYITAIIKQVDLFSKLKYSSTNMRIVFYLYKLIGAVTGRLYEVIVRA